MKTLKFLLEKEFRQIFRNPNILRLIIAIPIIQLLIMPLAADYEIKNIRIGIVDHDRSALSRGLVDKITASGYFQLADHTHDFRRALSHFESDESDLILEIPNDFERNLMRENQQTLFLAVNAINGTKAGVGSGYLSRIIRDFDRHLRTRLNKGQGSGLVLQVNVENLNWFNAHLNYQHFMVPGILVILVTMVGSYMCALNIVKEKELGTVEQINVTPIRKHHFLLGKLIPFWVIGIVVFTIGLFGVGRLVYGVISAGSLWLLYGYLSLYLISVLGVGLLISTYSTNQQQAMSLSFFIMMIFILMSGLFTPIDGMPTWSKWIVYANPVTYFIDVVRMIIMKGSEFRHIQFHILITLGFAILFNGWAIWNYRKTT